MEVYYRITDKEPLKNVGIGLGNFDGIHIGHEKIINTLKEECDKRRIQSLVYTFRLHPNNILFKSYSVPVIITNEQKTDILKRKGIDAVFFEEFDENYSKITPEDFIENIIVKQFNARLIVVGYDYTFGIKGEGKAQDLIKYGKKYGFEVFILPSVTLKGNIVSSTLLREFIKIGDMESYKDFTGRHYSIPGIVAEGRKIGSKLGFPTANILPKEGFALPSSGVYATMTVINKKNYGSITNIGNNPTFNGEHITVETHIFDYNRKLYGEMIEVFFYKKIRNEILFSGIDDFIQRLEIDIKETKRILNQKI